MSDLFVEIAVNISVNKTFHYRAPERMKGALVPGVRVLVPFGTRRIAGTVLGFPDKTSGDRTEVGDRNIGRPSVTGPPQTRPLDGRVLPVSARPDH